MSTHTKKALLVGVTLNLLRVGMPTNEALGSFYSQLEENVSFLI